MVKEDIVINFREKGINQLLTQQKRLQNGIKDMNTQGQRFAKQQKQINKIMTGGAQKLIDNTVATQKLGKQFDSFGGAMAMPLTNWRKFNVAGGEFNTIGGRAANRFRLMTHGLRGFRMEMLGVMFFGMGLSKFFTGLLRPALKLAGVFEIFSIILQVLFLPVAMQMLEWLLPIMDRFLELDESVQKIIGYFVIFGAILGFVLFFVGMMALGLGSLVQAFGWLAPLLAGITIGFLPLMLIIGAVIAIVALLWMAWQNNFGNIREWTQVIWEGIKKIFKGIKNVISGIIDIFIGFFTADGDRIKKGFEKIWAGVKGIFDGAIDVIVGIVVGLGQLLFEAILRGPAAILALLGAAFGILWEKLLVPAYEFGKNLLSKIVEGIKAGIGKVGGAIKKILGFGGGGRGLSAAGTPLPGSQTGGIIPRTGLRLLHAGEQVIQAGDTFTSSPTINVYGVGAEEIARQVSEMVTRDLANLARR